MSTALVVNADDFGLSPGVNSGVLLGHEQGIVTSASLMVRRAAAREAAVAARSRPDLSVGLHLDLGDWIYDADAWRLENEVADLDHAGAVKDAVEQQLERFRDLVGADPSHLDSHQHVHQQEPVAGVARVVAQELEIPLRGTELGVPYHGEFYGQSGKGEPFPQGISVAALIAVIEGLGEGTHEVGCHPGQGDDSASSYSTERELELTALCSPAVRKAIDARGIRLISFRQAGSG